MTVFIPCLDPGHGGKDFGAISTTPFGNGGRRIIEKNQNLEICKRLNASFAGTAIVPIMTRQADFDPSWAARYRTAKEGGASFVLSVHGNANEARRIGGAEAYHYPGNEYTRQIGARWLASMPRELRPRKLFAATDKPEPGDDWLQRPRLIITSFHDLPVLVAEYCYLVQDIDYLLSPWGVDRIVSSLRVAVVEAARLYS